MTSHSNKKPIEGIRIVKKSTARQKYDALFEAEPDLNQPREQTSRNQPHATRIWIAGGVSIISFVLLVAFIGWFVSRDGVFGTLAQLPATTTPIDGATTSPSNLIPATSTPPSFPKYDAEVTPPKIVEEPEPPAPQPEPTPTIDPEPVPTPEPTPEPKPPSNSIYSDITVDNCESIRNSFPLYSDPRTQSIRVERGLRENDSESARLLRFISCIPHTTWLVGGSIEYVRGRVSEVLSGAQTSGKTPIIVLYNLPSTMEAEWFSSIPDGTYLEWIEAIAETIGSRNAWVVLEPDALILSRQYSSSDKEKRLEELKAAVDIFADTAPGARVYIDAGHSRWAPAWEAAELLFAAGIEQAHGFTLNVSNYYRTSEIVSYGNEISRITGGKKFIIDTSRNGVGQPSDFEWCNAKGRALGTVPNFQTGLPNVDATLWIKPPGESDGWCNDGPQAGDFWLDYALDLVRNRP